MSVLNAVNQPRQRLGVSRPQTTPLYVQPTPVNPQPQAQAPQNLIGNGSGIPYGLHRAYTYPFDRLAQNEQLRLQNLADHPYLDPDNPDQKFSALTTTTQRRQALGLDRVWKPQDFKNVPVPAWNPLKPYTRVFIPALRRLL